MIAEIYLSSEELHEFLLDTEYQVVGKSYEWEGEGVIHLHTHPLNHAFGKVGKCVFVKNNNNPITCGNIDDLDFVVEVSNDNNNISAKVHPVHDGSYDKLKVKYIPCKDDLYSRSKGLLEIDVLKKKNVVIVGLGSFGSQIAIELTKSGVGKFSIFDFDRIELHNLARHICTTKDLGRMKVDAVSEAMIGKNPYVVVDKFPIDITNNEKLFSEVVKSSDLVICATDNNGSRFLISKLLVEHQKTGIFGRAITRAAGGDVFRQRPGGPCYLCLLGSGIVNPHDEEISTEEAGRRNGSIPAYASADDIDAMVQVGLSADIEPICNLMVKLALVELSKGYSSGISSLENDLLYDAYIWANRRDKNFSHWHPFYKSANKQTILKWYGVCVTKDENCTICSDNYKLNVGTNLGNALLDNMKGLNFDLDE